MRSLIKSTADRLGRWQKGLDECGHANPAPGGPPGHAPGTVGMRRKDGSFNAWTHGGEATQPFRIPDSVIRIERHHGAVGRHLSHPAPLPVKFAEHILRAYADEGDIVYEPWRGAARPARGQARLVGAWSG